MCVCVCSYSMYIYLRIHLTTIEEKEAMNLNDSKAGDYKEGGGRRKMKV